MGYDKSCNKSVNKFTNISIRKLIKDTIIGDPRIYRTTKEYAKDNKIF